MVKKGDAGGSRRGVTTLITSSSADHVAPAAPRLLIDWGLLQLLKSLCLSHSTFYSDSPVHCHRQLTEAIAPTRRRSPWMSLC